MYQGQSPRLTGSQCQIHAPHGRKLADLRLTASDRGATGGAAETLFAVKRLLGVVQTLCRDAPTCREWGRWLGSRLPSDEGGRHG